MGVSMNIGKWFPKRTLFKIGNVEVTTNEMIDLALDILLLSIIYIAAISDLNACRAENVELLNKYYSLFNLNNSDMAKATNSPSIDISKFNFSTQPSD